MGTFDRQRLSGLLAIIGGALWLAWNVGAMVHDFWAAPIGMLTYEHYNRLLTLPLVLLVVSWLGVDRGLHRLYRRGVRVGWWLVASGLVLLLAGNAIEFWLILLQQRYIAFRLGIGGTDVWPGAYIGWTLYLLGCAVVTVGLLVYGSVAMRVRPLPRWNAVPLATGLLCAGGVALTLLSGHIGVPSEWGFAVLLLAFGIGWVTIGYMVWRGTPQTRPS